MILKIIHMIDYKQQKSIPEARIKFAMMMTVSYMHSYFGNIDVHPRKLFWI